MRTRPAATIGVLALAVVLACTACGGEIVTYTDSEYGFSFDYDDSWSLQESPQDDLPSGASRSVGVFDPRGSGGADNLTFDYFAVSVYDLGSDRAPTAEELKTGFSDYLLRLGESDDSFWVIEEPVSVEVNGRPAVSIAYMFSDSDQEIRCTEYRLVDLRGVVYGLYTQSAMTYWESNTAVFETFLNSFTLGDDT